MSRVDKRRGLLLILTPALLAAIAAVLGIMQTPYLLHRFSVLIDPYIDRNGSGYIHCLVRDLLAGSKFWGKGDVYPKIGNHVSILPGSNTDYILATLTHNFGRITFIGISMLIFIFVIYGLYYAGKQKGVLGMAVSLSTIITFSIQSVIYITNNLGYGVASAISLPLVSYGNTALIINSALIGFMLSVFRTGNILTDGVKTTTK